MQILGNTYYNPYISQNYCKKNNMINFNANPHSHLLEFTFNDFFVNVNGYGRNTTWAREVKQLADKTTEKIKTAKTSDEVLPYIAMGVRDANNLLLNTQKKANSGILRTDRSGYETDGKLKSEEIVTYVKYQYSSYKEKFKKVFDNPIKNPYDDISITTVGYSQLNNCLELRHGDDTKINNALDRVGEKFINLKNNYISHPEDVTDKTLPEINSDIAEIRWIMAHSMPWKRGSDSISNVFMRSLYKSMGIKTYPIKEDISLDLEAFCTPLEEYKSNFTNYFEIEPRVTY